MTDSPHVRPAVADDAAGIAAVHVQSWRETYSEQLPVATLTALDESEFAARWTGNLQSRGADIWVAVADGAIVGWASSSTDRDDNRPHARELEGIYVVASHHGTGAGQRLMDAAVGQRDAYLWMAVGNERALPFYRRNGFEPDGAVSTKQLRGTPVEVMRLSRPLASAHADSGPAR